MRLVENTPSGTHQSYANRHAEYREYRGSANQRFRLISGAYQPRGTRLL